MILSGAFEKDDATLIRELPPHQRLNKQIRISLLVDKLIFHQFGNYGKRKLFFLNFLFIVLQKIIQVAENQ